MSSRNYLSVSDYLGASEIKQYKVLEPWKFWNNMVIYYLLIKTALETKEIKNISRNKLNEFLRDVKSNRKVAAENLPQAKFELLEFDKLSQQGTNDASNIKERVKILRDFFELSKEYLGF